jgi:hypothetical protein
VLPIRRPWLQHRRYDELEKLAGAVNLTLLGLNMRDGFKMTGRFKRRSVPAL